MNNCRSSGLTSLIIWMLSTDLLNFSVFTIQIDLLDFMQERIMKVILFIISLQSDAYRPFLIISISTSVPTWEAELLRLAPSVNSVVYSGNTDVRKSIRELEFYEESGHPIFQVLVSPPEAIVEVSSLLLGCLWLVGRGGVLLWIDIYLFDKFYSLTIITPS